MQAEPSEQPIELDALNGPQADAVAHAHGPMLVFAGAGSGKTRVITYRIANLVATHEVPPYRILAVTFTNKAAGEMRDRLQKMLGPDITGQLWIGTFHAMCVRLIRRYSEAIGIPKTFVIYDDSDQKALMKRVMKELDLDERRVAPQKVLSRISHEKQEARGVEDFEANDYFGEIVQRCYEVYQRKMRDANALDFSDLLLEVLRFVERDDDESAKHLCARFSHVLVDEFQDVNLVQYRLVRALAGKDRNICVVGDDDQSIYRWRGADVRNIRGFTRDYRDAKLVKLEQNYRSSANVVGAALGVIRPALDRQPKELWTSNEPGERVRVVHCANERDEAAWVVAGVKRAIAAGTSPREIAVFYRVHAQSRVLEEVMRTENVPYQIIGSTKFFDRAEVKDLMSYLRILVSPRSDVDLVRIINKPPRKIGKSTIDKLAQMSKQEQCSLYDAIKPLCDSNWLKTAAKRSLRAFDEMLQKFMQQATTSGPHELAEDMLTESGYLKWLEKQDSAEGDARIDNLREFLGSVAEYEEEMAYAEETPTVADYLTRISLQSDQDSMKDVPRVPMMTVHAAKGLEFDAVFITGAEERLFPLRGQEPGEEEELEEERRLAYVAITRARHQLAVTHTNTRMIYGQVRYNMPSRFLDDIAPRHQERVATAALHDMSRQYTVDAQRPSWRDVIRGRRPGASATRPATTRPATAKRLSPVNLTSQPEKPSVAAGERYVERDEHVDDVDMSEGIDSFSLRVGMNVRHTKFGVGQVQSIGSGSNPSIAVKFAGWGTKRIKLSYLSPA
jgi:DNA helicase-2/ATP-dependent DNA helicase PcrA